MLTLSSTKQSWYQMKTDDNRGNKMVTMAINLVTMVINLATNVNTYKLALNIYFGYKLKWS
jgi:hypothetical protein